MSDDSPQALVTRPKIDVQRYGKLPLAIAASVLTVLLVILIWSVQTSTDKSSRKEVQAVGKEPVAVTPPKPLVAEVENTVVTGLAQPEPPEEPTVPLVSVAAPPKVSEEYETRRKEAADLRQKRNQALEKALAGDLRISAALPARASSAFVQTSASPAVPATPAPVLAGIAPAGGQSEYLAAGVQIDERVDKEGFLASRARTDSQWVLPSTRTPGSPYEIKTGTVIPSIALTGINSDLPGQIVAQVARVVFDTATGEYPLVPQGAKFYGVYDSRVAMGQSRLLVAWNRLIFPDGSSVDLGAMPGADMAGLAGFRGDVDNHYARIFGQAAVMSLIAGGMGYGMDSMKQTSGSDSPSVQDEMGSALASQLGQTSLQILQRNMQIRPELSIEPGYRFNVVVTKDIVFDRPYHDYRGAYAR